MTEYYHQKIFVHVETLSKNMQIVVCHVMVFITNR